MVVCLPTGTGKTVIFSELAKLAQHGVLVLAHRAELLTQARDKIQRALGANGGTVAIEQGSRRAPPEARVVVASIRSLREERLGRLMQGRRVRLVIYDECHHAPAEDNRRVLEQIGAFEDDWPGTLLGFTATTQRGDGTGLDEVFSEIVYHRGLPEMIRDGYLAPLRGYRIDTAADLRALSGGGADFSPDELAEAVDIETRNGLVARSILELARDRRTLVFCVNVAHARHLARTLNQLGLRTGVLHGEMPADERAATLAAFRASELMVLTNVAVLTEGFDDPEVSAIAMARPTRSPGLYQQCVGRGTRLHPNKKDCLILDFVDVAALELVSLPTLFGLPKNVDLAGEDAAEAASKWRQLELDLAAQSLHEARSLTLDELRERAEAFDPLTQAVNPEVVAISGHAWMSLGTPGLVLHIVRKRAVETFQVLDQGGRAKRWRVVHRGSVVARFSRIEEAVEAVDYEVGRLGPAVEESAQPWAEWRSEPAPETLLEELEAAGHRRPGATHEQAVRLLAWVEHAGRARR
ncbi:MAG: superfamily II DNA or RNA helicase [Myxococcota bacterium]|jgi:superfamily II DNA or RNA helicase